jgi:beta-xylosidase
MDDAVDYSSMDGYHAFSSSDMVNWTDHGEILHSRDVTWAAGGDMYAPSAAYRDGTYFLYFGTMSAFNNEWQWRIGVATSNVPEGPFTDIGHFIEGTDDYHPECFIDDDGAAYLYWGGGQPVPKVARLSDNMIELAEEPRTIDYGADNFGEAAFMHKAGDHYYFSYNGDSAGSYSMGDNPYGPFAYQGKMHTETHGAQEHHAIVEYRGTWFFFYHVGDYDGGTLHRRNVCADYLYYNPDGTMQEVIPTSDGVFIMGDWSDGSD